MAFEQHIPTRWPVDLDAFITIRTKGCIVIRCFSKFSREFRLLPGTRVVLFYSTERKVIGIKPINDQSEYSPIKILGESELPLIYCKPFLDHYKIPHRYNLDVYDAIWNHEAGMLMIRLK